MPDGMMIDPPRARRDNGRIRVGKAVCDGSIRFLSVSQVVQFDPRQEGGCPRRWAYTKLFGKEEPSTKSQDAGDEGAKQLEHYLKTGEDTLQAELRAGIHLLPKPGKDLEVEEPLGNLPLAVALRDMRLRPGTVLVPYADLPAGPPTEADVEAAAGLAALGIPFDGAADLRHFRGEYVDEEGRLRPEPEGLTVCEVIDHKMTSQIRDHVSRNGRKKSGYAKTIEQICAHPQWLGYGVHAAFRHPELTHVRLSAMYYQTRGTKTADKRTALLPVQEIRERWSARVLPVIREMTDVAKVASPEEAPYNLAACHSFNKDCPHAAYCARPKGDIFDLLKLDRPEEEDGMAFVDIFADAPPSNGVQAPIGAQSQPPPLPKLDDAARAAAVAAEKSKFMEAVYGYCASCGAALNTGNASRAPNGVVKHFGCAGASDIPSLPPSGQLNIAAVNPADAPAPNILRDAAALPAEVIAQIEDPQLRGRATEHAAAVAALKAAEEATKPPKEKTGGRCPGGGMSLLMTKPETVYRKKKCDYCGKEYSVKDKNIKFEGDSILFVVPTHNLPKPSAEAAPAVPELPSEAPAPDLPPDLPQGLVAEVPEVPELPAAAAPRGGDSTTISAPVAPPASGITLFVDVFFDRGASPAPLDGWYLDIVRSLEKAGGVRDIRHAPDKHDLGFGRWRGALAAAVRACPPPPGEYVVSNYRSDEIAQEVVNALAPMCERVAWPRGGAR